MSDNSSPQTLSQTPKPKTRYYTRARIMRRLLLLLGLYLGFCAGIAWLSVCPHRSKLTTTPHQLAMPFENVAFHSSDGTPLAGWYIPATGKPRGVVILCHGVDGNRIAMLLPSQMLHKHGYATLLFDFRARGESGGNRCTLGYRETDDLLAAIAYVRSRPELKGAPLGLMGHSEGAAVVLMATARSPEVSAVVAESPFAQLDHAVDNHFRDVFGWGGPLVAIPTQWFGERLIGRSASQISPLQEMPKIAPRPVLLIQDAADTLCPPSETRCLLDATYGPKTLWTVPNADHIQAYSLQPDEFQRRTLIFFDTYLK